MWGAFVLDARHCIKWFTYRISFNLEKVSSIFVEEFFIKQQYYQSCDKAGSYRDEAHRKLEDGRACRRLFICPQQEVVWIWTIPAWTELKIQNWVGLNQNSFKTLYCSLCWKLYSLNQANAMESWRPRWPMFCPKFHIGIWKQESVRSKSLHIIWDRNP